jgi:hypothetical protein
VKNRLSSDELPLHGLQEPIGHCAALNHKTRLDLTAKSTQEPSRSARGDAIKVKG